MLVLTRKLGEEVTIGDSVSVRVLEIRSGQVKLGFEAPDEIKIHRREIANRIAAEAVAAAGAPGEAVVE